MFVDVKGTDNKIYKVPKTFYETVMKGNGFTLVDSKAKQEVEDVRNNARAEKQDNRTINKTNSK